MSDEERLKSDRTASRSAARRAPPLLGATVAIQQHSPLTKRHSLHGLTELSRPASHGNRPLLVSGMPRAGAADMVRSHLAGMMTATLLFALSTHALADESSDVPPGYHLETSPNWTLIGPGIGVTALGGLAFLGAASANKSSDRTDTNELLGPALTLSGIVLATAGLTLGIVGLAMPNKHLVPNGPLALYAVPVAFPSGAGLAAAVLF